MNYKILHIFIRKISFFLMFVLIVFSFLQVNAQETHTVTGTVYDGNVTFPLVGATVLEKGTTHGTVTDVDGKFTLDVSSPDAYLVVEYIGYVDQEIHVNNQNTFEVVLQADLEVLDELVVIGFQTIKKNDVTGSVGSMNEEGLTSRMLNTPLENIQGNIAGVQISQSTGRLGDGYNMVIRGNNSLNEDSQPLYVVDGAPVDNIDFLNPSDIHRIDVLKDASSTAIYGSRGSNGVVLVTTKSGIETGARSSKALNVTLNSYYGWKTPARLPKMMESQKWWYYHKSAYLATTNLEDPMSITPEELHSKYAGTSNSALEQRAADNEWYDWYDLVLQNGSQHNTHLNFSGRSDNGIAYNFGFGIQNETGLVMNESLDNITTKLGMDHQVSSKFSYGVNTTFSYRTAGRGSDLAMREAFRLNPFLSPFGLDGKTYYPQPGKLRDENGDYLINKTSTYNPLLEMGNSLDQERIITALASMYLRWKPLKWFAFRTNFIPSIADSRRGYYWGAQTNQGISNKNLPSGEIEYFQNVNYTWDNQIELEHTFNQNHRVSFLGLQSIYYSQNEGANLSSREMPFETGIFNLGSGAQSTFNVGSYFVKQTLASFAMRANYGFKDKYLVTASVRWDGSSLFSEGNKWAAFPSAAIAWVVSNENFLVDSKAVTLLKLRLSYGFTGNNIISPYSSSNILDVQTFYDFFGTSANGWMAGSLANSILGWEKTREFDIGIDFGFVRDRIMGSIDFYSRLSDDLLMQQNLPVETGYEYISANVGSVSNVGVEFALTTRNIVKKNVSWVTMFTVTKNTNKIESLYGQTDTDDVGNGWFIGESINSNYNYVFNGIWQANQREEAASYNQLEGQAKVVDQNGDGKITPEDDRIILGSSDPDFTWSAFSTLKFYNFDFSFSILGAHGVHVLSEFHQNFTNTRDRGRQKLDIDWYIPENGAGVPAQFSNEYPQPRNMGTYWRNDNVGYYRDASFVKIQNISLSYTFDLKRINSLRLFVNVIDPFVFSSYDGYDPEWADADYEIAGVGSVTYQVGLNVNF
jgi:TonB-linked SusC/RagA family outer membrane protein